MDYTGKSPIVQFAEKEALTSGICDRPEAPNRKRGPIKHILKDRNERSQKSTTFTEAGHLVSEHNKKKRPRTISDFLHVTNGNNDHNEGSQELTITTKAGHAVSEHNKRKRPRAISDFLHVTNGNNDHNEESQELTITTKAGHVVSEHNGKKRPRTISDFLHVTGGNNDHNEGSQESTEIEFTSAFSPGKNTLKFNDMQEFVSWKFSEEDRTNTRYVKRCGDKKYCGIVYRFFSCHRSGCFTSRAKYRSIKVQGTCKIGKKCQSEMRAKIMPTGMVEVTYIPKHTGHTNDIEHLKMRPTERQHIAEMLAAGIPFEDVLNKIQMSTDYNAVCHLHFVRKQDLQNIVRDFNLPKAGFLHKDNSKSVELLISQMKLKRGGLGGIRSRHQVSRLMDKSRCTCVKENMEYEVKESNDILYKVERRNFRHSPDYVCPLTCKDCNICVHEFACNCLDGGLRNTICKHVHLVMQVFCPKPKPDADDVIIDEAIIDTDNEHSKQAETATILQSLRQPSPQENQLLIRECFEFVQMAAGLNEQNCRAICEEMLKLKSFALSLMSNQPEAPMLPPPSPSRYAANENVKPQRKCFSIRNRRKRQKQEVSLSKPNSNEMTSLLCNLTASVQIMRDHDYAKRH